MQPVAFIWARTKDNPELTKIDNQLTPIVLKTNSQPRAVLLRAEWLLN